jgi:CheY-like chemotaxis protein
LRAEDAILLVEDDEIDVASLRRAFARNAIQNPLFVARNGEEALAFLRETLSPAGPGTPPRPGLVFLDHNMPRLGGLELLAAIRGDPRLRELVVVVLTTSRHETDRAKSFALGVAGYFVKPVDFDEFVEVVGTIDRYWRCSELAC